MVPEPTKSIEQTGFVIKEIPTATNANHNRKRNGKSSSQNIKDSHHKENTSMKEILTGFQGLWECVKTAKGLLKEPWITIPAGISAIIWIINWIKRKGRH